MYRLCRHQVELLTFSSRTRPAGPLLTRSLIVAKSTRRIFMRQAGVGTLLSLGRVLGGSIATVPSIAALGSDGGRALRAVDSAIPRARGASSAGPQGSMRAHEFGIVGQYDVEWLLEPRLQRLLDNMAASRPAFSGVRSFHSLDSGTRASTIQTDALDGGTVWNAGDAPVDFSTTFKSLEALTSRNLTPFVGLNFFPKAIADRAISPPASFDRWKALVRRFFDELAADSRFGAAAIRTWWFEVWNEPNGSLFWQGHYNPQYFDLYRATSEAVVASGHAVRLGGPAIVYDRRGAEARTAMEEFLKFLSAEPDVKCEFISLHAKGAWSSHEEPEFLDAFNAAVETADLALAIDRSRFSGLAIVNDEADAGWVRRTL
jgi:glycosyl hydrolase family 39 (putative alpha-L-iduronidase)